MGTTLQHGIFLPAEGERNCYAGLASNWTILDGVVGGYSSHAANLTIHVTAADKEAWNGKADASALTAHTGNTTIHVTAADKEAWNGKADASALTAHTGNTTIHVTAEDKAKWDAVTTKANDANVVHNTGNETISGDKVWIGTNTFQKNVTYQRTNFYHQVANPCYILKDTELEKGNLVSSAHTAYPGLWQDKNSNVLGYVRFVGYNSGRQTAEFKVSNLIKNGALDPTGSEVNCAVDLELQPSGERSLIPEQNDINLGTSTNKWKTFNGLTPSSLGMPVIDRTKYVDISGYFTNTGNGDINTYSVTANGWVFLRLSSITGCQTEIYDSSNNKLYAMSTSGSLEQIMIPVVSGVTLKTQWATGSAVTVNIARFIPCQGNI